MSPQRTHPGVTCRCETCGRAFHPPWSYVRAGLQLVPGAGRFCSVKCGGVGRRGERASLQDRFWAKVNKNGPMPADESLGNCWVWTGSLRFGYGQIWVGLPRREAAHRVAFVWANGPIPGGMVVRHRCDRRCCVRATHLDLGTASENSQDWVRRGAGVVEVSRLVKTPPERFWAKVNRDGPVQPHCPELGPCWEWVGAKDVGGYGAFRSNNKCHRAHRFAWEMENGPIPDGLFALHRCDNRRCVRLSHLRLGTQSDNARDTIAKGRHQFIGVAGRVMRGEASPNAKITADAVREIRRRKAAGETSRAIAEALGVTKAIVNNIWYGKAWGHLK